MTLSIHDAVALLREIAPDRNHTIECEREGYNPPFDGDDCLRCRADAALAQYEADMAQHRKDFARDVKDLDRHLAAHRAWKGDK